jgi:hypothetical protein
MERDRLESQLSQSVVEEVVPEAQKVITKLETQVEEQVSLEHCLEVLLENCVHTQVYKYTEQVKFYAKCFLVSWQIPLASVSIYTSMKYLDTSFEYLA